MGGVRLTGGGQGNGEGVRRVGGGQDKGGGRVIGVRIKGGSVKGSEWDMGQYGGGTGGVVLLGRGGGLESGGGSG